MPKKTSILIKGAGIGGLVTAFLLQKQGYEVTLCAPSYAPMHSASWYAGGMLAPYCEAQQTTPQIKEWGLEGLQWWLTHFPEYVRQKGTLVVAPLRDTKELSFFAAQTTGYKKIYEEEILTLEPDLEGRFAQGLFFESEAHMDPRLLLLALKKKLKEGGAVFIGSSYSPTSLAEGQPFAPPTAAAEVSEKDFCYVIDATGSQRIGTDKNLRGVRGEMILLKTQDISFSRPIRLLHPRWPIYIVPRANNIFMVGASMIESAYSGPITARSMMEFLNSAYTLHPAFAEAEIVESASGVRTAYSDNLPRITKGKDCIYLNGFYRHGYLFAPRMAQEIVKIVQKGA